MKIKQFLFFLGFMGLLGFYGCSKDEVATGLEGEWQWIKTYGGIGGWTYTPAFTGKTEKLIFDSKTVKMFVNDTLDSQTTYTLSKDAQNNAIIVFGDWGTKFITISPQEIEMTDGDADGFTYYYERK